jgi:predicted Zn-dependent protease
LPDSPLIMVDLAKVELGQKQPKTQAAITRLEKANSIDASNAYAWRLLATAYGKAGMQPMAYLALAEEAGLQGSPDDALRQAELAIASLPKNSPSWQRAQDLKARMLEMQREKKEAERPF